MYDLVELFSMSSKRRFKDARDLMENKDVDCISDRYVKEKKDKWKKIVAVRKRNENRVE